MAAMVSTIGAVAKPFDIVLFGATSYVGALTAEYLLTTYGPSPPNFKWALAGRSEEKLQALTARLAEERDSAASGLPTILADSMDDESLARMVAQAKVILTCVGPYQRYGSKLVAACARAGVHYCDLTGESPWVADMIDRYHEEAERTGAKIVPSCGLGSIPADMGVFMMVEHMKRAHGTNASDVRYFLRDIAGGMSGGTIASAMGIFDMLWGDGRSTMDKLEDPLLFVPPSGRRINARKPGGLGYDSVAKTWTSACLFASNDTKVVHRSASLLDYGQPFQYKEVVAHRGTLGFVPAVLASFLITLGGFFLYLPPTRTLLARFLPKPGQGPSREVRDKGYGWVDFIAKGTADGKEVTIHGTVGSDKGDLAYKETAKMLVECGLCLVLDEDKLLSPMKGGVLTTAFAMGAPLLERLRKAGMTFEVSEG